MAKQGAVNLHDLSPEAQKALGVKVTGKGRDEVDRLAMRLVVCGKKLKGRTNT